MADCGDLEKLPPEIRNEIYALVLVQTEPFALCNFGNDQQSLGERSGRGRRAPKMKNQWARTDKPKVAPVGHKRNLKGRGHKYVKGKWVEVPSNIALLCVNKKICQEAAPVLYSRTKFRFVHANTMRRFLVSIGNNIQYLRDVGITRSGWEFRGGYVQARLATEALAAAKSMHTFEVTHRDVCPKASARSPRRYPGVHKIVGLCRPLLDSLKTAHKSNELKASVTEVIKIGRIESRDLWSCGCTMKEATKANVELQRGIKRSIAEQHGLELEL
jgi:hypothetical protein